MTEFFDKHYLGRSTPKVDDPIQFSVEDFDRMQQDDELLRNFRFEDIAAETTWSTQAHATWDDSDASPWLDIMNAGRFIAGMPTIIDARKPNDGVYKITEL